MAEGPELAAMNFEIGFEVDIPKMTSTKEKHRMDIIWSLT